MSGLFLSIPDPDYTWLFSTSSTVAPDSNPVKCDSMHLPLSALQCLMHWKCHKCLGRRHSCTGVSLGGGGSSSVWGNTSPLDIRWHLLECTCRHGNSQSDAKYSSFLSCLLVATDTNQSSVQTRTQTQRQNHNVRGKVVYLSMERPVI